MIHAPTLKGVGIRRERQNRYRTDRPRAWIVCTREDGLLSKSPVRSGNRRIVLDEGYEVVRFFPRYYTIPKGEGEIVAAQWKNRMHEFIYAHEVETDTLLRWAKVVKSVKAAIPGLSFWLEPGEGVGNTNYQVRYAMPHQYTIAEALALRSRLGPGAVFYLSDEMKRVGVETLT